MKYLLILFLAVVGCTCSPYNPYPVNSDWNKERVIEWLEGARDSHVRNRGVHNLERFDDWCLENYNQIIDWVEENTDG